MPVPMRSNHKGQSGSALILIAVVLVFVGFLLTLGIGRFATQDQQDRIQLTAKRQQLLVNALAAYTQRENHLPCPADPTISPTVSGFGFSGTNTTPPVDVNNGGTCANTATPTTEGLVPFRTLGLEPYDAIDGWGNYMTYHVSPISVNPIEATSITTASIYMRCRRFEWFDDGLDVYASPYTNTTNVYPQKAVFCCPPNNSFPTTTDLQILKTSAGASIDPLVTRDALNAAPINTITSTAYPALLGTSKEQVFAFAIISHGANGAGAYVPGTATRLSTATAGTDEIENANGDNKIVDRPMSLGSGANYFDDIVVWRTQTSLMSQLSNASCYLPWR